MQKNYLIIGAVIITTVILAGGGFFFLNQNQSSENSMMEDKIASDEAMMKDESIEGDESMADSNSAYIVYSNSNLESASDTKRVLFFYANWCPICRPVDTELKENINQIPEDVTVIRVNYNDTETDDAEKELAKKYGVTYQHTFVQIDEEGNEIKKWNGGGLDEILTNVK